MRQPKKFVPAGMVITDVLDALTVKEAAKALRLQQNTIRDWVFHRRIDYVKIGARVFIPTCAIQETIKAGYRPAKYKLATASIGDHFSSLRRLGVVKSR